MINGRSSDATGKRFEEAKAYVQGRMTRRAASGSKEVGQESRSITA